MLLRDSSLSTQVNTHQSQYPLLHYNNSFNNSWNMRFGKSKNTPAIYEDVTTGLKKIYKVNSEQFSEFLYYFTSFRTICCHWKRNTSSMNFTLLSWRMLTLMESPLWWWWDNTLLGKLLLSSKLTSIMFFLSTFQNNRYILEQEYPGMRIGPEPTTDTFHIIDYGEISKLYCIIFGINLSI